MYQNKIITKYNLTKSDIKSYKIIACCLDFREYFKHLKIIIY